MTTEILHPGDRVQDCDDPEPNDAIVVNQPLLTASEWTVTSRDSTLAEDNPDYPADAAVAVVCFCDDLIEYGPPFDPSEQHPVSLDTLIDSGVNFYAFPVPRLTVIESPATGLPDTETPAEDDERASETATTPTEPSTETETDTEPATAQPADDSDPVDTDSDESNDTDETDPSPELDQLTTTLEAEGLSVTIEDTETLAVERLGQTYRIHADGSIEGDGALRAKLASLLENAR